MPLIAYENKRMGQDKLAIISQANDLLEQYAEQGYDVTLRQLYYRFIAMDLFPSSWIDTAYNIKNNLDPDTKNTQKNYKRLGGIVNDARMTGRMDWDQIVDRTRELDELPHWNSPTDLIVAASKQFRSGLWERQDNYVEVWIEKDALEGVIDPTCKKFDVPFLSCRGYTSQSEMWIAGQRLREKVQDGKKVTIFHLGDHDPSGIDMTRDIEDRLNMFIWQDYLRDLVDAGELDIEDLDAQREILEDKGDQFKVERVALNFDQVEQYNPPPNPAKSTDSRYREYMREHGDESWELDALDPPVLAALVERHILDEIDAELWDEDLAKQKRDRELLAETAKRWTEIIEFLENGAGGA